ncbi:FliG C-terminal domain-containing protein [Alkalispirochaeta americana]|uniref:FliG C-terminal domain-containing protein n=1 Tax=Alkalispirochaeta americana TaxID=159291 RepID=A0A1N6WBM2_9SPIO|nr:FliG C-terminal domain-containing protein [Alkalispirochaeta americana]SIQ87428.1 FliG C-terminal domain-containing protein [Alkalispirochaeta americana]
MTKRLEQLIDFYVSLSEIARKEGLLALEDQVASCPTNLSRVGIQLIADGVPGSQLELILDNCIADDLKHRNVQLWDNPAVTVPVKIEKTALMGIYSGENPRFLRRMLLSHLGACAVLQDFGIDCVNVERERFLELLHLKDLSIQRVLREFDTRVLAEALSHAGDDLRDAVMRNLSKNAATMLQEELEGISCSEECCAQAQIRIGEIIGDFLESGELISDLDMT